MPRNAKGGFVFEWVDQWWPAWEPWVQNVEAANQGWNQEFLGLISLGDGSKGTLVRQLRKAYGVYEQL